MLFKFYTYPTYQRSDDFDFGHHDYQPFHTSRSLGELFKTHFAVPTRKFATSENDTSYILTLELPGFKQSHLDIELEDYVLSVLAKKDGAEVSESVDLPIDADVEKIEAKIEDGILTITVGKIEQVKPRKIQVK